MDTKADTWMVEVLADGTGPRHRLFLVGADDRESAVKAVLLMGGSDVVITSSTKLSGEAAEAAALQAVEVRQI